MLCTYADEGDNDSAAVTTALTSLDLLKLDVDRGTVDVEQRDRVGRRREEAVVHAAADRRDRGQPAGGCAGHGEGVGHHAAV